MWTICLLFPSPLLKNFSMGPKLAYYTDVYGWRHGTHAGIAGIMVSAMGCYSDSLKRVSNGEGHHSYSGSFVRGERHTEQTRTLTHFYATSCVHSRLMGRRDRTREVFIKEARSFSSRYPIDLIQTTRCFQNIHFASSFLCKFYLNEKKRTSCIYHMRVTAPFRAVSECTPS